MKFLPLKVQWKHHPFKKATLDIEKTMGDKYPQIFTESGTTLPLR